MENVCRLCASQSNTLESVFSFQNNRLVTDLIAIICPIKIDINDALPKQICEECLEIVVSASKLRETSVRSDLSFRTGTFLISQETQQPKFEVKLEKSEDPLINSYLQTYSDEEWDGEESNDASEYSIIKNRPLQGSSQKKKVAKVTPEERRPCPSGCGKSFSFQSNVKRHVRRFHDPELLPIPCSLCTFRFKSKQKLSNHITKVHERDPTFTKSRADSEENQNELKQEANCRVDFQTFECDLCGRRYTQKIDIVQHMKTYHLDGIQTKAKENYAGVFSCDICFKEFSFTQNVYRHKMRFHSEELPFSCKLCADRFMTHAFLKSHHEKAHRSENFLETQRLQPEDKGLTVSRRCQFCGKDFQGLKRRLETHLLRDHFGDLENVLDCEMCPKKFAFGETLRVHIQTHKKKIKTQSYPHGCEICGRRFLNEASLIKHKESHKRESGLTCHVCGKQLSSASALEHHIHRHKVRKIGINT